MELQQSSGSPFAPPIQTASNGEGNFTFTNVPADVPDQTAWIHVIGNGPASDGNSTYDALSLLNVRGEGSRPGLVRVATMGTAGYSAATGDFTPRADRTALQGAGLSTWSIRGAGSNRAENNAKKNLVP